LTEALQLATKLLAKSMDDMKPTPSKFEIGIVTRDKNGAVVQRSVEGAELEQIIKDAKIHEMKANDKKWASWKDCQRPEREGEGMNKG